MLTRARTAVRFDRSALARAGVAGVIVGVSDGVLVVISGKVGLLLVSVAIVVLIGDIDRLVEVVCSFLKTRYCEFGGFSMGLGTDCNDMFNQLSGGKLNPSYG